MEARVLSPSMDLMVMLTMATVFGLVCNHPNHTGRKARGIPTLTLP